MPLLTWAALECYRALLSDRRSSKWKVAAAGSLDLHQKQTEMQKQKIELRLRSGSIKVEKQMTRNTMRNATKNTMRNTIKNTMRIAMIINMMSRSSGSIMVS